MYQHEVENNSKRERTHGGAPTNYLHKCLKFATVVTSSFLEYMNMVTHAFLHLFFITYEAFLLVFTHGVWMGGWVGGGKKFVRAVSQKL